MASAPRRSVGRSEADDVIPGADVLHPAALVAVVALVVNDHLLKESALPAVLTGKLSDVAGLILLPLLLKATWEWCLHLVGRRRGIGANRIVWAAIGITAAAFTAINVSQAAADVYGRILGFLQWLPSGVWASVHGSPAPPILSSSSVPDLADLVVLPASLLPVWLTFRRARQHEPKAPSTPPREISQMHVHCVRLLGALGVRNSG
jgi:hypothetical protein